MGNDNNFKTMNQLYEQLHLVEGCNAAWSYCSSTIVDCNLTTFRLNELEFSPDKHRDLWYLLKHLLRLILQVLPEVGESIRRQKMSWLTFSLAKTLLLIGCK